jgi:hypothetical protein
LIDQVRLDADGPGQELRHEHFARARIVERRLARVVRAGLPSNCRASGEMEAVVAVAFDDQVTWDGGVLHLRATRGTERIRCRAGREAIAELAGFTHASSLEIGERKAEVAELLKSSIVHKIEIGGFDHGPIKTVTVFRYDLLQR